MGFIGIVIAELLITPTGIGDLISYHGSTADYPKMFATIASIVAVAAISLHLLQRLELRLFPRD
jgi:NitT/TauT family transport system permease protein